MIWTAAGLYAIWRLVVRPLLRVTYLILKAALLLAVALLRLGAGVRLDVSRRAPAIAAPDPGPAPDLGPASTPSTGDWRQDRETLKRLLAEGKIK